MEKPKATLKENIARAEGADAAIRAAKALIEDEITRLREPLPQSAKPDDYVCGHHIDGLRRAIEILSR